MILVFDLLAIPGLDLDLVSDLDYSFRTCNLEFPCAECLLGNVLLQLNLCAWTYSLNCLWGWGVVKEDFWEYHYNK